MNSQDLKKAKKDFIAAQHRANAARYVAMHAFREAYPEDFEMKIVPGLDFEVVLKRMDSIARKEALMASYFSGTASEEALRETFGLGSTESLDDLDPVIAPVPEKLVLLTFDDATRDHIEKAAPILEKYGGKGNFFVCEMTERLFGGSGFEDKSWFMTWDEIRTISDHGHEIVNHSWHHDFSCVSCDPALLTTQTRNLEASCAAAGVPIPITFGYPGGRCDHAAADTLHTLGYHWARGDMAEDGRDGTNCYDPYLDSPLGMPSFNSAPSFTPDVIQRILDNCRDGRVAIFAYHTVDELSPMSFEEQVRCIYENGGHCITFRELEQYIDPVRAYQYYQL